MRAIIKKLHQDGCSRMKQTVEVGDKVIDQLPRRQEAGLVKSGLFPIATTSRVQKQPRQKQWVNQSKPETPKRQFTKFNMSLYQEL